MGTTGVSKSQNKTMTGTITLHDIHAPVIAVTYTPDTTAKKLTTGNITLDTPVAMTISVTDSHLKSVAYYWGQPGDPSAEKLAAAKWQSIANGDCVVPEEGSQVLYVKAVDEDGNVTYFRSGTITVKATPVIGGVDPDKESQEYYPGHDIEIPGNTPGEGGNPIPLPIGEEDDWEYQIDLENKEVIGTDGEGNRYVWKPDPTDPENPNPAGTLTVTDKDGNPLPSTEENLEKAAEAKQKLFEKEKGTITYTDGDGNTYKIEYDLRKDPVIEKVIDPETGNEISGKDKEDLVKDLTGDDDPTKTVVHFNPKEDPTKTYDIELPDNKVSTTDPATDITYTFIPDPNDTHTPKEGTLVWTEKGPDDEKTYRYTYDPDGDPQFTRTEVNPDGTPKPDATPEPVPNDILTPEYKEEKKQIYDDLKNHQLSQNPDGTYSLDKPGEYEFEILDEDGDPIEPTTKVTILDEEKFGDENAPYPENPNGWKENGKDQNGEDEKERTGKDGSVERETQGLLDPDAFDDISSVDVNTNIYTKTVSQGPGAPDTRVKNSVQDLILAILNLKNADGSALPGNTADGRMIAAIKAVLPGANNKVDILTTIEAQSESQVAAATKKRISAMYEQLGGEKIAYLDIRMKAIVTNEGNTSEYPITRTASKISFSIDVPESLKDVPSGYTRSYMVLRDHGTQTTALTGWVKPVNSRLNFESDLFSPYAVICRDTRTPLGVISDIGDSIRHGVKEVIDSILAPVKGGNKKTDSVDEDDAVLDEEEAEGETGMEKPAENDVLPDEDTDQKDTSGEGSFAILNLILTLATVLVMAYALLKKKKWKGNLVAAIGSAILLILTTGIAKMVLVNWWTIAFAALFILQMGIYCYVNREKEEVENEG